MNVYTYRYAKYDESFQKEKKLEQYATTQLMQSNSSNKETVGSTIDTNLEWLDKLMLKQIQSNIAARNYDYNNTNNNQDDTIDYESNYYMSNMKALSPEEEDLSTYCCLVIDMPIFPYPVLYEENSYPSVVAHMPEVANAMLCVKGGAMSEYQTDTGDRVYEYNLVGKPFSGQALGYIVDWDVDVDTNPCEDMYRRLAHDAIRGRGGFDPEVKPNIKEKERIDMILNTPGDHIKSEDKDLLYKFRYILLLL